MRAPLAIIVLMTLAGLGGCDQAEAPPSSSSQREPRQRPGGPAVSPEIDLDLQAMLDPVPEYQGQGRNLFAFGPERRASLPPPRPEPAPPTERPLPPPTTTAPPIAPPARLNVKYAGFLEKTGPGGDKAKYAIFLDGNEILAGTEGDTLANRFTIVEIGLESVTVSTEGSSATQRIPLQSN